MLETIYVMTPGMKIRQDGGVLVIEHNREVVRRLPMATVGNLVVGRTCQLSTQVMFSLVEQGALIQFVNHRYQLVGTLGDEHTMLHKLLWQTKYFQDESFALVGAQYIVNHKVVQQLAILEQYHKSRSIPNYDNIRSMLVALQGRIGRVRTIDALRGIEGLASKTYFSVWSSLLSAPWTFTRRERHPSPDPVNALLSYGYSFLEREVRSCLLTAGLDIRIGVLHSTNNRKDSFVYDLMDLFRQQVIDRLVLKILNRYMLKETDFDSSERGCYLTPSAQKQWITIYESYMETSAVRLDGKTPRQWIQQEISTYLRFLEELSSTTADVHAPATMLLDVESNQANVIPTMDIPMERLSL